MTPDEFIDDFFLQHAAYDPVKRREYYLRNRKLKGRKKGQQEESSGRVRETPKVKIKTPPKVTVTEAQIAALKSRLARLNRELSKLLAEAREADAAKKKNPTSVPSKGSKSSASSRDLTPQQKKEAAQRSKEWREKNQKPSSADRPDQDRTIEDVKEEIRRVRTRLRGALEAAKQKSKNQTASKGR